jgi:uncharacterized protein
MWKRSSGKANTTKVNGLALRLTILVDEDDQWHHKPLYTEIVRRAHAAGLAGASVFRGIEGFGASSLIHTTRLLSLTENLPVAIVIIDKPERIRGFLPELDELIVEGLVTLDDVEIVQYSRVANPATSHLTGALVDGLGAAVNPGEAEAIG